MCPLRGFYRNAARDVLERKHSIWQLLGRHLFLTNFHLQRRLSRERPQPQKKKKEMEGRMSQYWSLMKKELKWNFDCWDSLWSDSFKGFSIFHSFPAKCHSLGPRSLAQLLSRSLTLSLTLSRAHSLVCSNSFSLSISIMLSRTHSISLSLLFSSLLSFTLPSVNSITHSLAQFFTSSALIHKLLYSHTFSLFA